MLFDEPFAGVDPKNVGEVQKVVYGLRSKGIAVFITDHDARQILSTSDRVYLMNEGQVVVKGAPQEILDSEVARRVYLGESFKLDLEEFTPQGVPESSRSAEARPGVGDCAKRARSISAMRSGKLRRSRSAIASSAVQNSGSREMLVRWPLRVMERLRIND